VDYALEVAGGLRRWLAAAGARVVVGVSPLLEPSPLERVVAIDGASPQLALIINASGERNDAAVVRCYPASSVGRSVSAQVQGALLDLGAAARVKRQERRTYINTHTACPVVEIELSPPRTDTEAEARLAAIRQAYAIWLGVMRSRKPADSATERVFRLRPTTAMPRHAVLVDGAALACTDGDGSLELRYVRPGIHEFVHLSATDPLVQRAKVE